MYFLMVILERASRGVVLLPTLHCAFYHRYGLLQIRLYSVPFPTWIQDFSETFKGKTGGIDWHQCHPSSFCFSRRTLMMTSITPSLVTRGEPKIHPIIYQLYFMCCLLNRWIPDLLVRSYEKVSPSLLNANTKQLYWPRLVVSGLGQVQVIEGIRLRPLSQYRRR